MDKDGLSVNCSPLVLHEKTPNSHSAFCFPPVARFSSNTFSNTQHTQHTHGIFNNQILHVFGRPPLHACLSMGFKNRFSRLKQTQFTRRFVRCTKVIVCQDVPPWIRKRMATCRGGLYCALISGLNGPSLFDTFSCQLKIDLSR